VGAPKDPQPVKLVASIIFQAEAPLERVFDLAVEHWGMPDFVSETVLFAYTDYYAKEMGKNLQRRIISFQHLVDPAALAGIKRTTNDMEQILSPAFPDQRSVNIDPGYINASHLILATTKPAPHRPYIQQGIYADLTLVFQHQRFQALPWTYPDYGSEKMAGIFSIIRQKYLFQCKQSSTTNSTPGAGSDHS